MDPYALSLPMCTLDDGDPARQEALQQGLRAAGGWLPNMYANMAHSPGVLTTYLDGYDRFRSASGFSPVEQEVVYLVISRHNECTYCMAAHSVVADKMSKVPAEVTDAIRVDEPLPDARLDILAAFTRELLTTRGRPSSALAEGFLGAGFTERHMLEIILAISTKVLSNYANRLFQTPLDAAFSSRAWAPPGR